MAFGLQLLYIDLLDLMNSSFKKIAYSNYDKKDVERLFELSKTGKYPSLFTEMAESFAMMMVKVEARDFQLQQVTEELEKNSKISEAVINDICNQK
jgi:phosphoribosyl-ATP pyrophosphohydrolase